MTHMSEKTPGLPLVWDATMLNALMTCEYYFQLVHLDGWQKPGGKSVDLMFGGFLASAWETYKKSRLNGDTKHDATLQAVAHTLEATWDTGVDGGPWGGRFERQWRCLGTEPYKNSKGNRAKCPYSHKGIWWPQPAPDGPCGMCGSPTEQATNYIPEHPQKNRVSLIRAIVWWCDEQPQDMSEGMHPYKFPDGTPAVELAVATPLPFTTGDGERFVLAGFFDEIAEFENERFVLDNKSTKSTLGPDYFARFAPNVQFDTYDLLAKAVYPSLDIKGVIIDSIQMLKDVVRTARHVYYKSDSQREEHLMTIGHWLMRAEADANSDYWPMNKKSCAMCSMKTFCALPPEERVGAMKAAGLIQGPVWDPTATR